MQAETLNCPMCGAAASTASTRCLFCDARLATVACPSCFGMMFTGNRHCPRCGAQATAREELNPDATRRCPRCRVEMSPLRLGEAELRECARCGGLWVNVETFERICADREQQAVVLGSASPAPAKAGSGEATSKVRYIPCPECGQLMNRVNFAHCSGVVVDICKGHGTWFDRDELAEIVGFIRGGGLEAARAREKRQLEDERRRLRQEQLAKAGATDYPHITADDRQATESGIVSVAGSLLKLLLD